MVRLARFEKNSCFEQYLANAINAIKAVSSQKDVKENASLVEMFDTSNKTAVKISKIALILNSWTDLKATDDQDMLKRC